MRELSEYPVDLLANIEFKLIERGLCPFQHVVLHRVWVDSQAQRVALVNELGWRCQVPGLILVLEEPVRLGAHTVSDLGSIGHVVCHHGVIVEHQIYEREI